MKSVCLFSNLFVIAVWRDQNFWEIDIDFLNVEMNTDVIVVKDLWYLFLSIHLNDVSGSSYCTPARDRSFIIGCEQSLAAFISLTQWSFLMFLEYKIISFFFWNGWQTFSCGLCVKMNNKSRLQWGNNN
jgi:hypothetical protein